MIADRYAQPLSTTAEAAEAFDEGVHRLLAATGDPVPCPDAALAADPDFALAWVAGARACLLAADGRGALEAQGRAEAAVERRAPTEP